MRVDGLLCRRVPNEVQSPFMRAPGRFLSLSIVLAGAGLLAFACRLAGFGLGLALVATPASGLALAAAATLGGAGALAAGSGIALAGLAAGLGPGVALADGVIHGAAALAGGLVLRALARRRSVRSWTGDWALLLAGLVTATLLAALGTWTAARAGLGGAALSPLGLALRVAAFEPLGILTFGAVLANWREIRAALADWRPALGLAAVGAGLLIAFGLFLRAPVEGLAPAWAIAVLGLPLCAPLALRRESFLGAAIAFLAVAAALGLAVWGAGPPDSPEILAVVFSLSLLVAAGQFIHVVGRDRAAALAGVEAQLAERTARIEMMDRQAREGDAARSRLLATVSHEVRTPLNGVLGMTAVVLAGPLDPGARRNVEIIRASGFHLLTVVNRILDYTRLENAPLGMEAGPFDLGDLVEEVLEEARFLPFAAGLDLHAEFAPGFVMGRIGSRQALRQVLTNLVGNACRFTDRGSVVLRATERDPGVLRLEVEDTGRGVPPEERRRIFQPFEQEGERRGGTGLGLAICAEVVERMGGRIGVTSAASCGALFWVEAPVPAEAPVPVRTSAAMSA